MASKKADLVDSFVFRKAKINTNKIKKQKTSNQPITDVSPTSNQPMSDISPTYVGPMSDISPTYHRPVTNHQPITDVSPTSNQPITDVSPTSKNNIENPCYFISDRTAIILGSLILAKQNLFQRTKLAKRTGINPATIRQSIRTLVKHQFITKPERFRNQGSIYKLHSGICNQFMTTRWLDIVKQYGNKPKITDISPTCNQPVTDISPTCNQPNLFNSSSLYIETTTIKKIEIALNNHPEFGYWRQKGLTSKQIEQWIKTTNCSVEIIIQYLCYCRFEMVDLGVEESKPIKNVFNWFFKIIEKIGSYPKPKGYKSHEEKQLEVEREIVTQRKKEAQEAKELYQGKIEAEQDKKFWNMINDPGSDIYKQCFDALNSFAKKQPTTGKGFEMSMRAAFNSLTHWNYSSSGETK